MSLYVKAVRLNHLPEVLRSALVTARQDHGWSQAELGRRAGLPQVHISSIETGKVIPRYNTLLDLVRILDYDLVLVPRTLVPAVQSLIRDYSRPADDESERPLYAVEDESESQA